MRVFALFACLLACGLAPAQEYRCGPERARNKPAKPEVIALNREARKAPAFYVREGEYVMFFKPEDVLETARAREKHWADEGFPAYTAQQAAFIASLSADLPLREHTDLYKYSLRDKFFQSAAEDAIDVLLREGRASVAEWRYLGDAVNPDKADARIILRASIYSGNEEMSRLYCAADGTILAGALYVLY